MKTGGVKPRPYARLPKAPASYVRGDVGIAPYENAKCPCVIRAGGQSRPPLQPSTVPTPCSRPVIPSQCSHWRGNPFPAPTGAEHPRGGLSKGTFRACGRGVLLPSAAKVPKNAVQTCGLKIPHAPSPAAYLDRICHANAVPSKFHLNVALSLLLFPLPLLLRNAELCGSIFGVLGRGSTLWSEAERVPLGCPARCFAIALPYAHLPTAKTLSNRRPKAATYLCRFAAKARFDNRPNSRRVFPKREGRSPPSLVVSRGKIFKKRGKSKSPFS